MNRRKTKKVAKRYLDGCNVERYLHGVHEFPNGNGNWRAQVVVDDRLRRAIYAEAYRRGWDGYWADNPLEVG